jgi:3-oxoacyl-[acyl-carrier-protein] synthase II
MAEHVVVTGVGAVSPLGLSARTSFDALLRAESGIALLEPALGPEHSVRIAGQVRGFESSLAFADKKQARRHARFTHLAVASAREAVRQAQLEAAYPAQRFAVVFGTGMGGLEATIDLVTTLHSRGPAKLSPFGLPAALPSTAAAMIAELFGAQGSCHTVVSACASGAHAIGQGADLIKLGRADAVIVGGSEATLVDVGVASFAKMQALSVRNDQPSAASRPFDQERDGFVMAEGAAALVLEKKSAAVARGAPILAELKGYGSTCDGYHITRPREDGSGAERAMRGALLEARVSPAEVDYLNAHGTGTQANDAMEARAINRLFAEHRARLWVSATKSMTGHMLGAAGAFEAVVCVLALQDGAVPPTINVDQPDPLCEFELVRFEARRRPLRNVLSNSFAFGGHNVSLLFAAP